MTLPNCSKLDLHNASCSKHGHEGTTANPMHAYIRTHLLCLHSYLTKCTGFLLHKYVYMWARQTLIFHGDETFIDHCRLHACKCLLLIYIYTCTA